MNEHVHTRPISIDIQGMSCASCVARVEKALLKVPGVTSAAVNLATERATVSVTSSVADDALLQSIAKAGYSGQRTPQSHAHGTHHQHHDEDAAVLRRDVLISSALTLPVFIVEMLSHFHMPFHMWLMSINAGAVCCIFRLDQHRPGRARLAFFQDRRSALLRGASELNSLVALGASAAYLYSVVVTFAPQLEPNASQYVYCEAAAVIVTLILVGSWLEALSKGTGEAIPRLREQANTARVLVTAASLKRRLNRST